jgi:Synaptobrevin/Regulated-SNARE-like domain
VFVEPGRRYTNEGDLCSVHFVADDANRVYTVVTDKQYPARVAFALLDEVQSKFLTKVGDKSLAAKEGSLSRTMRSSFTDVCLKYDDVKNVDKLASVQGKVDAVKSRMEDNISQMLANEEKLESISANAENLNEQAKVFQNRTTQLRRAMRCKALKMWFLLAFVITIVLIIIIVPVALYCKKNC